MTGLFGAMSEPAIPRQFGAWTVVGFADRMGRHALCRCTCGAIRTIARDALESGESQGCGCTKTPSRHAPKRAPKLPDWRPQR